MTEIIVPPTGTAVAAWDPNSGAALPAYLADTLGELGSNIPDRQTVPSLSYEGKTWAIHKDGNKTKLQAQNADGDMVPIPIMRLIVLNFNGERGRALYQGTYNPAASAAPICWSADGKAPDASVKEKQSPTCQNCPQAAKGSKVQDGKEMVACSQHRMLAVAPAFDILSDPLRLKIAVTSDYDKEIVEHGWFAFRQYVDYLKSRGVNHTALVITKVKFDMQAQYPKLLFALDRVLTQDEVAQMKQALANPQVEKLLAEKWTAAGTNGTPTNDSDIAPQPNLQQTTPQTTAPATAVTDVTHAPSGLAAAVADGWLAHPNAPGYHYKGQDVVADAELAARYPAPAPAAAPAAPAAPPAPAPEPVPAHDPMVAARADGWLAHPDAAGYHYRGQEVVADGDLAARYPSASAATPAASAPAATPASPSSTSDGGQTAQTGASPSEAPLPADVANLLSKWNTPAA